MLNYDLFLKAIFFYRLMAVNLPNAKLSSDCLFTVMENSYRMMSTLKAEIQILQITF